MARSRLILQTCKLTLSARDRAKPQPSLLFAGVLPGVRKLTNLGAHRLVDRSPPDLILGGVLLHDSLVTGGTTSLSARVGSEGTGRGDGRASLVHKRILVKSGNGRVLDLERPG